MKWKCLQMKEWLGIWVLQEQLFAVCNCVEDMKNSTECVIKLVNGTEQNYFKVWSNGAAEIRRTLTNVRGEEGRIVYPMFVMRFLLRRSVMAQEDTQLPYMIINDNY